MTSASRTGPTGNYTKFEMHMYRQTRIDMNLHYAFISGEDLATTRSELQYFKIYELGKKPKNAEGWTV